MNKLISIIIPIYNSEKYLWTSIKSVLNQTYKNIEIVCINDGSKDRSLEVLEKIANTDKRVKIYTQKNSGVQVARLAGFRKAQGEYIFFLDSDDWIEKDAIDKLVSITYENDVDVVKGLYYRNVGLIKKKVGLKDYGVISEEKFKEVLYPKFFNTYDTSHMWGQLIKKSCIKEEYFNTSLKYAEDLYFNVKLYTNIKLFAHMPIYLYNYIDNADSAINKLNCEKLLKKINDISIVNLELINHFKNSINKEVVYSKFFREIYSNFLLISLMKVEYREQVFKSALDNDIINNVVHEVEKYKLQIDKSNYVIKCNSYDEFYQLAKKDILKMKIRMFVKKIIKTL